MVGGWGWLGFWRLWLGETSRDTAIRRDWPRLAALAVVWGWAGVVNRWGDVRPRRCRESRRRAGGHWADGLGYDVPLCAARASDWYPRERRAPHRFDQN